MENETILNKPVIIQPTLWDNVDLSKGLYHLSRLEWNKATMSLNMALRNTSGDDETRRAIDAVIYWQPRMQQQPLASGILADFTDYPFTNFFVTFKRNLLYFIADCFSLQSDINLKKTEIVFDLLLNIKAFKKAEVFISILIKRHPDKYHLLYLTAQAQWLKGEAKGAAIRGYIQALLYAPADVPIGRIENDELKKLISAYGAAMAPAYAWIRGIAPFMACNPEARPCDESHTRALNAYRILQQAHESLEVNDLRSAIRYRKQLKEESPELYETYYALLKQRK